MVHKPKHKVHSFRGLLGDGGQDEINLERQNANVAYRIVTLEIFPNLPGTTDIEDLVQVFREEQSSIPTTAPTVDFTSPDLIAAAFISGNAATQIQGIVTIFDNTLFSRNLFVTHTDALAAKSCNYYIEIEEVPISASALIQLKLGTARRIKTKESMG